MAVGAFGATAASAAPSISVTDLQTEYATNPIGIEVTRPRLGWRLESAVRGQHQTAYHVLVASSEQALGAGNGDLWDSGKTTSGQSLGVEYAGRPMASRQRALWKVRVWDKDGKESAWSKPASWEIGLLDPSDWKGEWIGHAGRRRNDRARYFRFDFTADRPVRAARVYVAGIGYHELRLNGTKVGDGVLEPGWTDFEKRILYLVHDVGRQVRRGANTVGVILGNGWYAGQKLRLQIELAYADGTTATFVTKGNGAKQDGAGPWLVTTGPIEANTVFNGETYDARLEKPGWDLPSGKPTPNDWWEPAVKVEPPAGKLSWQQVESIKVVETRAPVKITEPKPGVFVYDVGQNLAGWAELRARAPRGTRVSMKFAESLYPDGLVNQRNLRSARQTDVYIFKGAGEEVWEPRFTYHGFRFVQLEGLPRKAGLGTLRVRVVRSAVAPNGSFESSNQLLNRINKMVWWTEASNLHSVPTDCPQRNERMGWMNDLTVRLEESLFNFHMPRFYRKFIDDVTDTQDADGAITDTAPQQWGNRPADTVSASYLLMGWQLYHYYGDTRTLAEHFDGFKAWVDYMARNTDRNGVMTYGYYGDWSPPAAFSVKESTAGAVSSDTPLLLMSTGYLYYCATLLAQMAEILGKPAALKATYEALARRTAEAFNRAYWDEKAGGYGNNNQSANSFALFLGLVPEERRGRVVTSLVEAVKKHDYHLTTGNLCTKYLMDMLTETGHRDVALRIATKETYPSWGFMLAKGATTVWERWEHLTEGPMNSHNHPMMGSVGAWFYKFLGGIEPDPAGPGFKRFFVRPQTITGIDWVKTSYSSMYGRIESAWTREGAALRLTVAVPVNSTATVVVPAASAQNVTEKGKPAASVPGLRLVREQPGAVVFEAAAGRYDLRAE